MTSDQPADASADSRAHPPSHGIDLAVTDDRSAAVAALAHRLGGRVGLTRVLADLDRRASAARVPVAEADWGFRPDAADARSRRWWPQGVTTSADAAPSGRVHGRSVVLTSAYAKDEDGLRGGSRITVHDVDDPTRVRYRHVLLVEALAVEGELVVRPVEIHAGGLVWLGSHVHAAATYDGLCSFRLEDVVEVPAGGSVARVGLTRRGLDAFGHRYVLPLRFRYRAGHAAAVAPLRHSFCSLDRTSSPHHLWVGEYSPHGRGARLARFAVDPTTQLLALDHHGRARATDVDLGVARMQGVAVVDGHRYLSTSDGPRRRGTVWSGTPGGPETLVEHPGSLPPGPEDLAYDPHTDRLWSVTEHPERRYVLTLPRERFGPPRAPRSSG